VSHHLQETHTTRNWHETSGSGALETDATSWRLGCAAHTGTSAQSCSACIPAGALAGLAGQGGGGRGRGGGKAVYAAIMEHNVMNVCMYVYVYLVMPVVARSEPLAEYHAEWVRRGFQLPACLQAQALSFLRCS
jgi:hypothetical protein